MISNVILKNNLNIYVQLFEYGCFEISFKLLFSEDNDILEMVLYAITETMETFHPDMVFDKFKELNCVSRLEELCNHPFEYVRLAARKLFGLYNFV